MLLLLAMIILQVLSTQGGVIQDYPYFSQDVTLGHNENKRPMQNINRLKMTKNVFFTFNPDSVRVLNEYIWIDHQ